MLRKLLSLLTASERKKAYLLLGVLLFIACLDALGVASILPFMGVLANPSLVHTNESLNRVFVTSQNFGIDTVDQFLVGLGALVFLLLIISLVSKAFGTYALTRFALMREYSISKRLVEGYLHQPYSWFLNRHSADLGKTILSEVNTIVSSGMMPLMRLVAQTMVVSALLGLLLLVDPLLALTVGTVLGISYAIVFSSVSALLKRLGQARIEANQERFTIVSEAFGAAKEVKVGGLEHAYVQRFGKPAATYAEGQGTMSIIAAMPRFALEAIAFGGMLLVILHLMVERGNFAEVLPILALYAMAGYRLMPALQQIYQSVAQLRFVGPALDALHKDLRSLDTAPIQNAHITPLPLRKAIRLQQVSYSYPNAPHPVLNNIDLAIPAYSTVGFVGITGSGKTTTVDIILALLEPQEGCLAIDDRIITDTNRRQWQSTIGYVPQQIYLADDSIAANIAFGVHEAGINQESVERAAKIANLHEFVINDLPNGYSTTVGERGIRLSGGQRQRIGIARALYHNPQVLVMDEATSSLDKLTEQAVMEAVSNLGNQITIIIIAHRLSTVRNCDQIFLLSKGQLEASGTYSELIISNRQFAEMVRQV